jgi:hypothetical protein
LIRSVTSIPGPESEIELPQAGDIRMEGTKKFIWTIKTEGTISIGEWKEEAPTYNTYDYYSPTDYI